MTDEHDVDAAADEAVESRECLPVAERVVKRGGCDAPELGLRALRRAL